MRWTVTGAILIALQSTTLNFALAGCLSNPQTAAPAFTAPVQWHLQPNGTDHLRGTTFQSVLIADIAPGWHLYALDEPEDGPLPLEITVPADSPAALVSVGAARPLHGQGVGLAQQTAFYVGTVPFQLHLRVQAQAVPGTRPVQLTVRFQACNQQLCLPPRRTLLELPLTVEDR